MNPQNHTRIKLLQGPSTTLITNSSTTTANFDTIGASFATITINLSAVATTASGTGPTISILEADDTNATSFAAITADRADEALTIPKTVVYHVDLRGRKRYLRLSLTSQTTADTHGDHTMSINGMLHYLGDGPSSTGEMVSSDATNAAVAVVV